MCSQIMRKAYALAATCMVTTMYAFAPNPPRDACAVALISANAGGPDLPKIVHQQWPTENLSERAAVYHNKFLSLFPEPEYQHVLWTDVAMREFVAQKYAWFLPTYDAYDKPIMRVDAFRYIAMHAFGGLYADMDYEPLVNFWSILPRDAPAIVESVFLMNEEYQNSLMSSPKGHPFWIEVLSEMVVRARRKRPWRMDDNIRVLWLTGPQVLSDVAQDRKVRALACENFQRKSPSTSVWYVMGIMFKQVRWCGTENVEPCEFARHHSFGSWVDK